MTAVTTDVKTAVPDGDVQPARDVQPALSLLDDPDAVEAWLCAGDPDRDVGDTRRAHFCPLAMYLTVHNGQARAEVAGRCYYLNGKPHYAGAWAGRFVYLVDRLLTTRVSARRALKILAVARDTQRHLSPGPDPYDADDLTYNSQCLCPRCGTKARPS